MVLLAFHQAFLLFVCTFRTNTSTPYAQLPAEAWFANILGMLILVFGLLVLFVLAMPVWKRPDVNSQDTQEVVLLLLLLAFNIDLFYYNYFLPILQGITQCFLSPPLQFILTTTL